MRDLTINELESVSGGFWGQLVVAVVGAVAGAIANSATSSEGASATLANGSTIQCEPGQDLEINGDSATCS